MYYIYMLRCGDGSLYTGYTADFQKRLRQHRGELPGGAKYTRSRGVEETALLFSAQSRREAMRLEAFLKRLTRQQKLALIQRPALLKELLGSSLDAQAYTLLPRQQPRETAL